MNQFDALMEAKATVETLGPNHPEAVVCSPSVEQRLDSLVSYGMHNQGDLFRQVNRVAGMEVMTLPWLQEDEILLFEKLEGARAFVQAIEETARFGCNEKTIRHVMRPWLEKAKRRRAL